MKLWRVTGEERYLKTARFFIDCRGRTPNYLLREMNDPNHKVIFPELRSYDPSYSQSHVRPVEQKTMEGHAVRAMYQCSAMADLADIQQDEALRNACQTLWDNVTKRRMYITAASARPACSSALPWITTCRTTACTAKAVRPSV